MKKAEEWNYASPIWEADGEECWSDFGIFADDMADRGNETPVDCVHSVPIELVPMTVEELVNLSVNLSDRYGVAYNIACEVAEVVADVHGLMYTVDEWPHDELCAALEGVDFSRPEEAIEKVNQLTREQLKGWHTSGSVPVAWTPAELAEIRAACQAAQEEWDSLVTVWEPAERED